MAQTQSRVATAKKISYRVLGSFYGKGIIFLATAYVSRALGPEYYGHVSLVLSLYSIFMLLGGFQLSKAVATWVAQEPSHSRTIVTHGFAFQTIAFVATLALFQIAFRLFDPLGDPIASDLFVRYMPFIVLYIFSETMKCMLQGLNKIRYMTILEALQGTLKAASVVVFIMLFAKTGWLQGRIIGEVFSTVLIAVLLIPVFTKSLDGKAGIADGRLWKRFKHYYTWSTVSGGIVQIQLHLQPFLVLWILHDTSEIAFIKIALLYLTSLSLFSTSITTALYADIAKLHNDRHAILRHLDKTLVVSGGISILLAVVLAVVAKPLILLLHGEAYLPVVPLFRVFMLASVFQHVSFVNGGYWLAVGNVKLQSYFAIVSVVLFLLFNFMLVGRCQLMGLAWAMVLSRFANALLSYISSRKWILTGIVRGSAT